MRTKANEVDIEEIEVQVREDYETKIREDLKDYEAQVREDYETEIREAIQEKVREELEELNLMRK